jgi:hypothetical protein
LPLTIWNIAHEHDAGRLSTRHLGHPSNIFASKNTPVDEGTNATEVCGIATRYGCGKRAVRVEGSRLASREDQTSQQEKMDFHQRQQVIRMVRKQWKVSNVFSLLASGHTTPEQGNPANDCCKELDNESWKLADADFEFN